jgi:hypothetical protein
VIDLQEKEPRNRVSIAGAPERLWSRSRLLLHTEWSFFEGKTAWA